MKIRQEPTKKARIEIIPMIDAIFFLLVFFMFSSLSMVRLNGSNVDLPTNQTGASGARNSKPGNRVVVTLTAKDALFLDKTPVSRMGLQNALEARLIRQPDAILIVNLSKNQTTQNLIDMMDTIGKVRLPKGAKPAILIATEPVDSRGNALPLGTDVSAPR